MFYEMYDGKGKCIASLPHWSSSDSSFHEGLLALQGDASSITYVKLDGKILRSEVNLRQAKDFSEGRGAVQFQDRLGWAGGYINRHARLCIGPLRYATVENFNHGRAIVKVYKGGHDLCGLIDRNGKFLVPMEYDSIFLPDTKVKFQIEGPSKFIKVFEQYALVKYPPHVIRLNLSDSPLSANLTQATLIPCVVDENYNDSSYGFNLEGELFQIDSSGKPHKFDEVALSTANQNKIKAHEEFVSRVGYDPEKAPLVAGNATIAELAERFKKSSPYFSCGFLDMLPHHNFIGSTSADLTAIFGAMDNLGIEFKPKDCTTMVSINLTPGATCGNAASRLYFAMDREQHALGCDCGD